MKTTYAVLFTVITFLLLGCIGKIKQLNDRIEKIEEPVAVATFSIDKKMAIHLNDMEHDIDMLKIRVGDLEEKRGKNDEDR